MSVLIDRAYLESIDVLRLQSAARAAGLSFKNGTLKKSDIVDRLCLYPSIGAAAIAVLRRAEQNPAPVPMPTKPRITEWLEEEPTPQAPTPIPAPAPVDLSEYVTHKGLETRLDPVEGALGEARASIERLHTALTDAKAEIASLRTQAPIIIQRREAPEIKITGQRHRQWLDLYHWLECVGRVILTGPAGTGKSRAALQAAEAFGTEFYIQTPVTQSHDLIGDRNAHGEFQETPLFKAYTRGGLCLLDEADSSAPDAMLVANPILDGNGFAMFGDGLLHRQHEDFRVILNMNTQADGASLAYAGRNPLDGATLARFGGMIHWGIDPTLEQSMAAGEDAISTMPSVPCMLMDQRGILTVNATPRHTLIGAKLLKHPHFANRREWILEQTLRNGAVGEIWPDVLRLPAVREFLAGF